MLESRSTMVDTRWLICFLLLAGSGWADTVDMTDGRQIVGKLLSLGARQAVIQGPGARQTIAAAEIVKISLGDAPAADLLARKGQHVLRAHDGSCLAVREVSIRDGKLQATSAFGQRLSLPLDRVARILRPAPGETPGQLEEQLRQLGVAAGKEDVLVVRTPVGPWVPVSGILGSLQPGEVVFTYEATETSMKDDSIAAVVLAATKPGAAPAAPGGVAITTDGSRIVLKGIEGDAKTLGVESVSLGALRLPREAISEIQLRVQQRAYLSDMAPAEVRQTPFFDDEFPWQKDRSVSGQALVLAGATYEKGLGLHARCRMTFELRGEFRRLSAVAGIDDDVQSGRAVLSVLADGKPLVDRLVLDRAKPPQKLDVDLRAAEKLTVLVDFAEGSLGSGARVCLGDAALAK